MYKIIHLLFIILSFACTGNQQNFELCGMGKLHPYYYPVLKYKGDFYAIKQHFYQNYKVPPTHVRDTGIVKIRFHINCKGQAGNYLVETYNLAYVLTTIDPAITNQLLSLTQKLQDWIPAVDEEGDAVNSHKFLAFKIEKGQLIDILPK